jgi:hypothetical protein
VLRSTSEERGGNYVHGDINVSLEDPDGEIATANTSGRIVELISTCWVQQEALGTHGGHIGDTLFRLTTNWFDWLIDRPPPPTHLAVLPSNEIPNSSRKEEVHIRKGKEGKLNDDERDKTRLLIDGWPRWTNPHMTRGAALRSKKGPSRK